MEDLRLPGWVQRELFDHSFAARDRYFNILNRFLPRKRALKALSSWMMFLHKLDRGIIHWRFRVWKLGTQIGMIPLYVDYTCTLVWEGFVELVGPRRF